MVSSSSQFGRPAQRSARIRQLRKLALPNATRLTRLTACWPRDPRLDDHTQPGVLFARADYMHIRQADKELTNWALNGLRPQAPAYDH